MPIQPILFSHTRKHDGSHESVCVACLAVIASHPSEAALAREEEEHICKFALFSRQSRSLRQLPLDKNGTRQRTVHAGVW